MQARNYLCRLRLWAPVLQGEMRGQGGLAHHGQDTVALLLGLPWYEVILLVLVVAATVTLSSPLLCLPFRISKHGEIEVAEDGFRMLNYELQDVKIGKREKGGILRMTRTQQAPWCVKEWGGHSAS